MKPFNPKKIKFSQHNRKILNKEQILAYNQIIIPIQKEEVEVEAKEEVEIGAEEEEVDD